MVFDVFFIGGMGCDKNEAKAVISVVDLFGSLSGDFCLMVTGSGKNGYSLADFTYVSRAVHGCMISKFADTA